MSSQIRLRLLPGVRCLFDEPIQVKVAGLKPRQVVSVRARATDEGGLEFRSSATYKADGSGFIHLDRDPSLGGSYVGVEPMGLLWSLKTNSLHRRFNVDSSLKPFVVKFSVHEGEGEGRMLAEATNDRFKIGEGVSRVPLKDGSFDGVLFTPPGKGPFPAVLDLSSYTFERRASLLANKGFVVLALPVMTVNDQWVTEIHLDRYEQAVKFLLQQPKVGSKGVGIISRSKAGDVAASLATFVSGIEAVVMINSCCANIILPLYYKGQHVLPGLMFDMEKMPVVESGAGMSRYAMNNPLAEENKSTLIPIEQAEARFLFVAAEDDLSLDSKTYMNILVERLKHHGKRNFECVSYPGAGHILEPPYGAHYASSYHRVFNMPVLWGGEPRIHAAAEVHLWKKVQEFFRTHLSCGDLQTKPKL
ncbi:acyl-coenzyme A thioesterase 6-like [Betta splendens]|uniref:Acyl-coenzyme A thioesterase 6-like n=1 Tax=Betta splendens TaxID=158456 RepID=A0A6P7KZG5_BETSP|nr:acyl-coenzyme A thioesterase 6-like [Betta splendens]XP_028987805.1 acyl-coenzyme A thioesterase 6-like [Betta splendens]XP_028987806.1 acyl-coenzyme A thioesterase 6-like [Betta splendens]